MVVFRPLQHAGVTSCADDIVQKSDPALQDAVGAAFLKACSSSSLISLGRGRTVIAEHESRGWMVGRHHRRDPGGFIIRAGIYSVDISFSLDQMRGNGVEIRIWVVERPRAGTTGVWPRHSASAGDAPARHDNPIAG